MSKIINFQYTDESQQITNEIFMFSENQYQLLYINKYLALNNDKTKLILTENLSESTSYWQLLQSTSSKRIGLYNCELKSLLTYTNNEIILSSSKLIENEINLISLTDLWIPQINISSKITFNNASNIELKIFCDDTYLLTNDNNNRAFFDFVLDNMVVDFPGNCNIEGIKLQNVNCKYLTLENNFKY